MKKLSLLFIATLFICATQAQVQTSKLYVAGTVSSDKKMLVTVRETKYVEGNVVSAELNGKKTEAKTDNKGHAVLDFSSIAAGLVSPTVAVIKSFDKDGKLLNTANTTVQPGIPGIIKGPVMENLPANLPKGEAVTIPGKNLGADAQLVIGEQYQETLSASDKEITTFTNAKPGEQSAYVITPNGVSKSQDVNVYSLDFALAKNSITPKENVQAMVHYESIPVGTKLIFTNKSPETVKMTIPGAVNTANECIYTIPDKNGSLPVNITGILKGNFKIALDYDFKNEEKDSIPHVFYDEKPPAQEQPPTLADSLKIKTDAIAGLEELAKGLKKTGNKKDDKPGVLDNLVASINVEMAAKATEQKILSKDREYDFQNLERNESAKDLKTARENLEKALAEEQKAIDLKKAAADKLNAILTTISDLKTKIGSAKTDEVEADKKKDGNKTDKKVSEVLKKAAEKKEKEASDKLAELATALNDIKSNIDDANAAVANAIKAKKDALNNVKDYNKTQDEKTQNNAKAAKIAKDLSNTIESLEWEGVELVSLSKDINKLKDKCAGIKDSFDKLIGKK